MAMTAMKTVKPFRDATRLLETPEKLRAFAHREGYLFFKKLLPEMDVLALRKAVMDLVQAFSWLAPNTPPMLGLADGNAPETREHTPAWRDFYCAVQKLQAFHALALHPRLIRPLEILFDEPVLPHSRNILRLLFPRSARYSTPPHQDNFYIGGSEETWTAWFALGDCPEALGGLACAPGSHKLGKLETHAAEGAGGRGVTPDGNTAWAAGPMSCGDVLFLHSLTVHQGRDNASDRLRLSCDYRYQPRSHPVRDDSLQPHLNWLTWEEIYADWPPDDPVKYYWRNWDLKITPRT
ncbi:MAG: phytanoyl-CoA dioxygenase family protein [bacterium]|nr:phytanoyl-CoA dioxygenase family protein [bacterium]